MSELQTAAGWAAIRHLVMFDIDGTLTLTNDVDAWCYGRAMFEQLGITIDDDWSHYRDYVPLPPAGTPPDEG